MPSAREVIADVMARIVDKPAHNMLAHEIVKNLNAAGYSIVKTVSHATAQATLRDETR